MQPQLGRALDAGQPADLICQLDAQLRASGQKREVSRFIVTELNNCAELKARIHEQASQRMQQLRHPATTMTAAERSRLVREVYEAVKSLVPASIQRRAAEMIQPAARELLTRRQRSPACRNA